MRRFAHFVAAATATSVGLAAAQQQCYYGPGAEFRGPDNLVPCQSEGTSACCLLGDQCLSGNACWDYDTGNTYQYGCTDITYQDASCPFKCGYNATLSPWTALEYCSDVPGVEDTWVCHSPESCGCKWESNWELLELAPRSCSAMGYEARAAVYAPEPLAPYLILPSKVGGSTGYFQWITYEGTRTWASTVVPGYTPASIGPLTTYASTPTKIVLLDPNQTPAPATLPEAVPLASVSDRSTPTAPVSTPTGKPATSGSSQAVSSKRPSLPATSSISTSSSSTGPSSSPAGSKTSSASASGASSAPTATTAKHSSGGLSSAAKIGIGVGVGIGAGIVLAAIAIFLLVQRRKGSNGKEDERMPLDSEKRGSGHVDRRSEWGYDPTAAYVGAPAVIHEAPLRSAPRAEMDSDPKIAPNDLPRPVYELEGDSNSNSKPEYPDQKEDKSAATSSDAAVRNDE